MTVGKLFPQRGEKEFNFRNFVKIDSFEPGVGLHAAAPMMMVDIRRPINVSKNLPATLNVSFTISSRTSQKL